MKCFASRNVDLSWVVQSAGSVNELYRPGLRGACEDVRARRSYYGSETRIFTRDLVWFEMVQGMTVEVG